MKARYCDLCDDGYDADALCELLPKMRFGMGPNFIRGFGKYSSVFEDMPNVMSFAINVTNSAVDLVRMANRPKPDGI